MNNFCDEANLLQYCLTVVPTVEEKRLLLQSFYGDFPEIQDDTFVIEWYEEIFHHLHSQIALFEEYVFSDDFPFYAFTMEDICTYLLTPSLFQFSFKRERGQGLLYGLIHTSIRRSIFNELPITVRKNVIIKKLNYYKILENLNTLPFFTQDIKWSYDTIEDVQDIGMGHSVYYLRLQGAKNSVVIKSENLPYQAFYCQLLHELEWRTFFSYFKVISGNGYGFLQYLGNLHLGDYIRQGLVSDEKAFIIQLAEHAALGDLFGRGDRHFENYMVYQDHILPVDISYLFWPDNLSWLQKYVAGGLAEVTFLDLYSESSDFIDMFNCFLKSYEACLDDLFTKKESIIQCIHRFFSGFDEAKKHIAYINDHFSNLTLFKQRYRRLYATSFFDFQLRKFYKNTLIQIYNNNQDSLLENDRLRMYFLADQGRFSAFFLWDAYQEDIVRFIQTYAIDTLGVSLDYFFNAEKQIFTRKNETLRQLAL